MNKKIYTSTSPNKSTHFQEKDISEDINLKSIVTNVWNNRKFILLLTSLFLLLGVFIAFTSPASYTASSTLVPQLGEKKGGNLGGLASMMGVDLGSSMSSETLSPAVYPQIINSVPFCKDIMETPIVINKSNGVPITLYEYYTDERYRPINVLGSIKKYTIGLPGLFLSALRSASVSSTAHSDTISGQVVTLTEEERRVIKSIQKSTQFQSNPKDGYITIGYSFTEPQPTAVIAQNMYATLEKYVTNYKSQKQQDNLTFVEESYEKARKDFMEKQAALATFQDTNRGLTSAMARTTERQLSSEYEVAYTVYNELARQLEQAKIAVKESTPVLTVINPVVVPHQKSGPRKLVVLIFFMFTGIIVSISWVFVKPLLQELIGYVKEGSISSD